MTESINMDTITNLTCDLNIADGGIEVNHGSTTLQSSSRPRPSLEEAIQKLLRSTNNVASRAKSLRALVSDTSLTNSLPLALEAIGSIRESTSKLSEISNILNETVDTINEATERAVLTLLIQPGSQSADFVSECLHIKGMLAYFDTEIRGIVRKALYTSSGDIALWTIAEECYKQTINSSGTLHSDHYFISREKTSLGLKHGREEHENRVRVDKAYAESFQRKLDRKVAVRRRMDQDSPELSWQSFWITVLHECPAGPTLFYPPAAPRTEGFWYDIADVPPYLFRTFDEASSGKNNENIIASTASRAPSLESPRIDLLGREKGDAREMLYRHLKKNPFNVDDPADNLMSWTSSLLFAIQYAIWRNHHGTKRNRQPSDIKICAIDTSKFPQGQFARDLWLIETYRQSDGPRGGEAQDFFNFRTGFKEYYNGEYLSQGVVTLRDRSCIVSLDRLIGAGLFNLYPEFEEVEGSVQWTARVKVLRKSWAADSVTTNKDIELALNVGQCFGNLEAVDTALLLLTLKNRRIRTTISTYSAVRGFNERPPEWGDKPEEVGRYWTATEAVKSGNEANKGRLTSQRQGHYQALREIFA